jgi:hypothetical protein
VPYFLLEYYYSKYLIATIPDPPDPLGFAIPDPPPPPPVFVVPEVALTVG